jgi:type II secretory pathway component PulF
MKFVYEALTVDGKRKRGEIEADHIEIAKQKLKREGKYLISLEESKDKKRTGHFSSLFAVLE